MVLIAYPFNLQVPLYTTSAACATGVSSPGAAGARHALFDKSYLVTIGVVITKEEFELRRRQWAEMNQWEREQPPEEHSPEWLLAAMGALHQWLPESTRAEEPDPERRGIQRMHQLLELLSRR